MRSRLISLPKASFFHQSKHSVSFRELCLNQIKSWIRLITHTSYLPPLNPNIPSPLELFHHFLFILFSFFLFFFSFPSSSSSSLLLSFHHCPHGRIQVKEEARQEERPPSTGKAVHLPLLQSREGRHLRNARPLFPSPFFCLLLPSSPFFSLLLPSSPIPLFLSFPHPSHLMIDFCFCF